jgi:hypothetical protein
MPRLAPVTINARDVGGSDDIEDQHNLPEA